MPDILIRDMKMPHSCMDCRLNVGEKRPEHGMTIVCKYSNGVVLPEVIGIVGRLPTCGLLELQPHGDLIDRNRAFRMMLDRGYQKEAAGVILEVPSVIPSNKGETP